MKICWVMKWLGISGAILFLAPTRTDGPPRVDYPESYQSWRHLGSVTADAQSDEPEATHGVIRQIYGNAAAVEGLRTGNFAEGAVFVADWFMLVPKRPGDKHEGKRMRRDVMVKDARFVATGGWGYERFAGDSRTQRLVAPGMPNSCFQCHESVRARDYVFTRLRL